ncbi:hypothetical protein AYL99_02703 [Fonsecaea erecta]|uniref:protein-histidine N-methyltransferase n=1 Tax=Fonsecaea erecta TaxID=1367422 RepID=A0A178ZVM3_9EURO|nr:hypothetical protein AYL99_02703 [Fonsecaea erecta]OAP63476.1 hypothetical protein AYL99_02703 [Fonsecaea erecta]
MSFSFGFSGDDIEDDDGDATGSHDTLTSKISEYTLSDSAQPPNVSIRPQRHSLEELSLLPKDTDFNSNNHGAEGETTLYRRSVFDIRAQLMAEANPSAGQGDTANTLLAGLESGDLSSGVYEGGFKTWECALDLASLVDSEPAFSGGGRDAPDLDPEQQHWEVIELGAGSAVPTLALIQKFLERRKTHPTPRGSLKVTLCDYNVDVLRLATAPNVLLNYLFASGKVPPSLDEGGWDGDLDVEELGGASFVKTTIQDMASDSISFDFISGAWGPEFLDLIRHSPSSTPPHESGMMDQKLRPPTNLLILASETIYSPASIKTFSETVIALLHLQRNPSSRSRRQSGTRIEGEVMTGRGSAQPLPPSTRAWVAAKRVYFGVGGGVDEFAREMDRLGARTRVVMDIKHAGVGRVVLEVTLPALAG